MPIIIQLVISFLSHVYVILNFKFIVIQDCAPFLYLFCIKNM